MLKINNIEAYKSEKVLMFDGAITLISKLKSQGKKVGLCHGGFDLLHAGHVKHFESAKKLCDVLLVSITSDKFVSKRKGLGRPIFNDKLRAYITASIEYVDYVVIADFNTGIEVIEALKPSFYIKGPDYTKETHSEIEAEREAIRNVGGEIRYTDDPKLSTTEIIKYIKEEIK